MHSLFLMNGGAHGAAPAIARSKGILGSGDCAGRDGGASRDRTDDPLLAKQVLSQLSYGPVSSLAVGVAQLLDPEPRA